MSEEEENAMLTLFWYLFLKQLNDFSEGKVAMIIEEIMRKDHPENGQTG